MCYIGDGNNMANSLIVGGLKTGMKVSVACPEGYDPDQKVLDFAAENGGFTLERDPMKAAENADVIFTDVWASMGQEEEQKKHILSLRNLLAAILILLAILTLLIVWGLVNQGLHTAKPAESTPASEPASSLVTEPVDLAPDFVGMDYDSQVRNNHSYAGDYLFYVTMEYSDTVEKGKIIRQTPEAGEVIEKGSTIDLVVSRGPQMVEMPTWQALPGTRGAAAGAGGAECELLSHL